ncbi:MAG: sensor histidine kinase [Desulfitobacterium hafniense]|nr:sensor histidine kinase [Desulfitobacterium hafniense]
MLQYLFGKMAQNSSLLITIAYLVSKTKVFKNVVRQRSTWQDKLILILIFSGIAIMGTYTGVSIKGALANSRVIGVVVGSLFGGPVVGIGAGIIAGIHRYSLGGFTAFACAIATICEATLAAILSRKSDIKTMNWKTGLLIGIAAETLQMIIILIVARPFEAAWDLVQTIGLPMIVLNSIGISIFIAIVKSIFEEQEKIGAVQAQKALQIAKITLPILRRGLTIESAKHVAKIIFDKTQVKAVAITDRESILAHVGSGCDHHLSGETIMTEATRDVISTGELKIAATKKEIGCNDKECDLFSAVIVPLRCREEVLGTLKLYQAQENGVSSVDIELAQGLAGLFSTQLELAAFEQQAQLVVKAELKALQAQINPHFLFNALNTVVSFCRTDPDKARKLLIHLSEFFRKNIQRGDKFVTLREELGHIRAYLSIEQARFGDSLTVVEQVEPESEDCLVPALTLQPLVENAIKHGIYPKVNGGTITIRSRADNQALRLIVEDDGVGMSEERIRAISGNKVNSATGAGIGLSNVNNRLKYLYGQDSGLSIDSVEGRGTSITITIPMNPGVKLG